nr:MAG TPA: hypothetical protein [Caudoviricetes sp.]
MTVGLYPCFGLARAGRNCRYWVFFPSSYHESCGKRKHGEDY